nr:zinc finger BED domain-containing protein RICESLEEPER 2-like [Ipomoea batatas]GMC49030.1 zinc finger BED domain-containing protein RICESLEEPER 2-like [Ipomoea batatas]
MCPAATVLGSEKTTMTEIDGGRWRCRMAGPGECSAVPGVGVCLPITEATQVKYGDTIENVKLLLSKYFTSVGEKFKSIICENLKCKRMSMKWWDTRNKVDYGVYLMRHMESYVGESVAKWDCGLTSGDRLQLQMLHLRYMKELSTVDINAHSTSNVAHALRFLSSQ